MFPAISRLLNHHITNYDQTEKHAPRIESSYHTIAFSSPSRLRCCSKTESALQAPRPGHDGNGSGKERAPVDQVRRGRGAIGGRAGGGRRRRG